MDAKVLSIAPLTQMEAAAAFPSFLPRAGLSSSRLTSLAATAPNPLEAAVSPHNLRMMFLPVDDAYHARRYLRTILAPLCPSSTQAESSFSTGPLTPRLPPA